MLIEDEILTLRRLCVADLQAFQSYRSDPVVGAYQSWSVMSDDQARGFLAAVADAPLFVPGEWSQIAIVADGLVGDIGLCLDGASREVEIGITLARGAQGLGYARRAVRLAVQLVWRDSPAQCIRAITDARNAAALILLERSGFREGPTLITDGIPERQFTLNRPNLP